MKYVQRFAVISFLVLALVFVVQGCDFDLKTSNQSPSPKASLGAVDQLPPPVVSYQIPYNPDIRGKEADYPDLDNRNLIFFDSFAWQTFAALNWPANCQGEPLTDQKISKDTDNAPRVWEFYRLPEEVFLPDGKDPTDVQLKKPSQCNQEQASSNQQKPLKTRITESGLPAEAERFGSEFSILAENFPPLIDQQGNYVINEIHINPEEFNQIVDNKWFDADNLKQFDDRKRFHLVCSEDEGNQSLGVPCDGYKGVGAIEIKAAWRVFDERNSDSERTRYYTTKRQLTIPAKMSPTDEEFKQEVDLGLVGFHITQKTSEQGWIWSTFEQVDNVPNGAEGQGQYTLYNPNCERNCEPNQSQSIAPYLWQQNPPHAVRRDPEGKIIEQISSQITRLAETQLSQEALAQVAALNEQWQKALKPSVWQYYKLIGAAWLINPQTPYDPRLREISPTNQLANVTLEPFVQKNSCIQCHTSAKLPNGKYSDFSFLMSHAKSGNSVAPPAQ
jgi:hypothetical protein